MDEKPKRGRRMLGTAKRINRTFTIDPDSEARIIAEAQRRNLSYGQMVDRMAKKLPPVSVSQRAT